MPELVIYWFNGNRKPLAKIPLPLQTTHPPPKKKKKSWQKYPFLSKLRTPPKKILATGLIYIWLSYMYNYLCTLDIFLSYRHESDNPEKISGGMEDGEAPTRLKASKGGLSK